MLSKSLLIGLGGFTGALLRYGVSGLVLNFSKNGSFPFATLVVNLLGCFLIGLLSQLVDTNGMFSPQARSFIFIGLLGAFTTYSTFGNETINLMRAGQGLLSLTHIGTHLLLGLAAVWLGRFLVLSLVK